MDLDFSMGDITKGRRYETEEGGLGLKAGMIFNGFQKNIDHEYITRAEIKMVDSERSVISGYLSIDNLIGDIPKLTTYFEGEIIEPSKNKFITGQWGSSRALDLMHWNQFPYFRKEGQILQHSYNPFTDDCVFMRWKELFPVPDYRMEILPGVSYSGFYYICYKKKERSLTGYYYHKDTELFQSIEMTSELLRLHSTFTFS